ncbi:hypothetical protein DdX_20657 [Ditylenchus destructor]|uniref:Uncharacterized protein n=1 Tax=Ditylenchus destructor TaxID=166010 RepID=A0AAD4QW72_9BILA|nr:hypothetical protein DdX_20657 [Ditylenchus destructor]
MLTENASASGWRKKNSCAKREFRQCAVVRRRNSIVHPASFGSNIRQTFGSMEDDLIHCMKPEGSVPSARDLLRKARGSEVQLLIQEELDEEEDYNNGYESNADIE